SMIFLTTRVALFIQRSQPSDSTYYAGVVEHMEAPASITSPRSRTIYISNEFQRIIASEEAKDLDIIVFPEHVTNYKETASFVPHGSQNVTPCYQTDYDLLLIEISCAARAQGIYVVINLIEKEICANGSGSDTFDPCPAQGIRYFNTNVVFDRSGRVISRYRKTHLWRHEYDSRSVLRQPDVATFATDFGVTFGHFICFDMLFYEPAMVLVRDLNITDIIYPTFWFSELPFLTALQLQEGWSFGNNVNLLAADASDPAGKTTGSGIYAGRWGRLQAEIFAQPTTRLMTARVPKKDRVQQLGDQVEELFTPQLITPRMTGVDTYRDYNVDIFETVLLEADFLEVTQNLCHGTFCCDFSVKRALTPGDITADHLTYRYRLAAYWGDETTVIRVDRSEQAVCAIFACKDESLLSCGSIFPASGGQVANKHHFTEIKINATFPAAPRGRRLIMPSTLDGGFKPIAVSKFNWEETPAPAAKNPDKETRVSLNLIRPQNDLLTFAIWANYYTDLASSHNLDHMQPTTEGVAVPTTPTSGASSMVLTSAGLLVLISLVSQF
ncbi:hypothetical protein KR026_008743, partial [Drosophila bipectinata]